MEQFNDLPEVELIDRILAGDTRLYELIVRRFNPYLYKIGRSYNYNHEDTQDLMQDSFVDAFKGLDTFEGRAQFKSWIMRIMLNNCYRRREKWSFKNETSMEINDATQPMFSHSNPDSHAILQRRELRRVIEDALSRLPLEYRMVFSLREINGLDVAETANILDISESNVKVRLNRAKDKLRREIEKSYSPSDLFEFNLIYCNNVVDKVFVAIGSLSN
ncbi:sigma-70 family RNA polymerase sigma factor [Sphingobacterium yanglingense]|uniref:RNA polymerase sigma-70 factor (ECF subfamily) n=1 Tax=Sphingobacterium yanglingense TaxID=1437280 RepID=A0A4R6WIT2_9SPHI|nr:sigma-70 family RNA polymerase sigma factor [Sphingobacterium yanglingense]TDQ77864.1 RNA polymerase sigma-70 factor (ECF subfamily) [Sphingobacterium yanglingense]